MFGGAEISLRLIGEKLAQRGHLVYYLTLGKHTRIIEYRENFRIYTLRLSHVPFLHRYSRLISLFNRSYMQMAFEKAVERMVSRRHIDLIHFYSPYPDGYSCVRVGKRTGIPVIQRIGGKPWERLPDSPPEVRQKSLKTFSGTNYFLATCKYMEDEFTKFYEANLGKLGRIRVLDIGMEIDKIEETVKKKGRLVAASNFKTYQKRQDVLVKAVSVLKKKGRDFELVLLGGGPNKAKVEQLAAECSVSERTRFLGWLPRQESLSMVNSAEMFIHASEYEGVGRVLLEAMLLAMPIVASKRGGIDECIIDNQTGILVDNVAEEWAEAIEKLMDDDQMKSRLGSKALDFVRSNFDPNKNILRYEEIFGQIVS